MLQFCLKKGIILKKIDKIMHATQETFMKDYITKNNDDRTIGSMMNDVFGVNHCKGLNNSLFRKQIQNVKHYSDTRIANKPEKALKYASKSAIKNWRILNENVTIYEFNKINLLHDKPLSVGFMILEISKFQMFQFYDWVKEVFGENMKLLYTDKDSLKLHIKNQDPYELEKLGIEDLIDTSNFFKDTCFPLKAAMNEKQFAKLKFENGEYPCYEYNGNAPKTYEEKKINGR